ncbi:MAG: transposase [Comamonadaceae bacterium]|nr:transposase [Comamonadaceae bacterium]
MLYRHGSFAGAPGGHSETLGPLASEGDGSLVLYDITSSYFEGEYADSEIVQFGYNRDGKRGHEQMVIGLLCSEAGCPVGVEVFAGNTQDASTVPDKIAEVQNRYGLKELIFVGDRGMITHSVESKLKGVEGLSTISALTHRQIVSLLERKVIETDLFDERDIAEVIDPEDLTRRYCLCRNPQSAQREGETRSALLRRTREELDRVAQAKRPGDAEKIGARVGRLLAKTRMGKFVVWSVESGHLEWRFDEEKLPLKSVLMAVTSFVATCLQNVCPNVSWWLHTRAWPWWRTPFVISKRCNWRSVPFIIKRMTASVLMCSCVSWPITCNGI